MRATTAISAESVDLPPDALQHVTVIIPALNEASSLPWVLADLPAVSQVIVVDNGSTDDTARIAARHGATVAHEPRRGYGAACLRGLEKIANSVQQGATAPRVVVFLDADYSDHPDHLPRLVAPILDGPDDFILGSRLMGQREAGAMPPQSVYGNRLACWLMRILLGARYTDLGPFRAIRYGALQRLRMCDSDFGWTIEMQIKAHLAKLTTREIPVPYRRRMGVSKISGTLSGTLRAGTKILYTIAKYGIWQRRAITASLQSEPIVT